MAQDKVNIPAPDSSNSNRRGFIGSAIAVFAGIAARLRRAPAVIVPPAIPAHVAEFSSLKADAQSSMGDDSHPGFTLFSSNERGGLTVTHLSKEQLRTFGKQS